MARDTGPQCKQCRREGPEAVPQGRALPDRQVRRRATWLPARASTAAAAEAERVSPAAAREAEGQALLRRAREVSSGSTTRRPRARPGITGENLLRTLECRFDNVLVRLGLRGFASPGTPADPARSLDRQRPAGEHPQLPAAGRRRDRDLGEVLRVTQVIRDATELTGQVPAWLQADHDSLTAKVLRKPERREIAAPPVQEQLIVELYSK